MDFNENTQNQKAEWKKYLSIALSAICAILPFCSWLEVPAAAGLYSMFGMSDKATKFSLFRYISSGSTYQDDTMVWISTIISLIAVIGIIFNVIYIVKSITKKEKRYKYGTIAAIIMLIVSVLFITIAGLMSVIMQIFEITFAPYILLIISIVNIIFIKKIKKEEI